MRATAAGMFDGGLKCLAAKQIPAARHDPHKAVNAVISDHVYNAHR